MSSNFFKTSVSMLTVSMLPSKIGSSISVFIKNLTAINLLNARRDSSIRKILAKAVMFSYFLQDSSHVAYDCELEKEIVPLDIMDEYTTHRLWDKNQEGKTCSFLILPLKYVKVAPKALQLLQQRLVMPNWNSAWYMLANQGYEKNQLALYEENSS